MTYSITWLFVSLVLVALCGIGCQRELTAPPPDPDAVARVEAGKAKVANAAWWGFDESDSTAAIQAAIDSGAAEVLIPNVGKPWIVTPIRLRSNQTLRLDQGVELLAKRGAYLGKNDSLLNAVELENVAVIGYGATIRMHKQDYVADPYPKAEWRMGVTVLSCRNVSILGLTIRDSGGDGIYLGVHGTRLRYCENVHIKDVTCDGNYRQGISVVSARNVLIEDSVVQNTSGTGPSAGIDCEAHGDSEILQDIVIRNVRSLRNDGPGFLVYFLPNSAASPDFSVRFENCVVEDCRLGLVFGGAKADGPGGLIEFRDCVVRNTTDYGLSVYDKAYDRALARFTRCTFSNVATTRVADFDPAGDSPETARRADRPNSAFCLFAKRPKLAPVIGGVEFIDCTLIDSHDRPWLAVAGTGPFEVRDVRGRVKVTNPNGVRMESPTPLEVVSVDTTRSRP